MKLNQKLLTVLCFSLLGCSGASLSARDVVPEQAEELIDVVSFDTGCPHRSIEIVDIEDEIFELEACGHTERYTRTDSVFHSVEMRL